MAPGICSVQVGVIRPPPATSSNEPHSPEDEALVVAVIGVLWRNRLGAAGLVVTSVHPRYSSIHLGTTSWAWTLTKALMEVKR